MKYSVHCNQCKNDYTAQHEDFSRQCTYCHSADLVISPAELPAVPAPVADSLPTTEDFSVVPLLPIKEKPGVDLVKAVNLESPFTGISGIIQHNDHLLSLAHALADYLGNVPKERFTNKPAKEIEARFDRVTKELEKRLLK